MYINLKTFTPLAVKHDLITNYYLVTLRGDFDLKSLKKLFRGSQIIYLTNIRFLLL